MSIVRKGDWMQTYTGIEFYPLDPRADEIVIEDIAHALAMTCRYSGHTRRFYSVAEHCVHVAEVAPPEMKLIALMHDASEAYLSDVIRPVKPFLAGYAELEEALMRAIADKFNFVWPIPAEIKRIDNAILADERDQIMAAPPRDWNLPDPPLGIRLHCWSPIVAKERFMQSFWQFTGATKR